MKNKDKCCGGYLHIGYVRDQVVLCSIAPLVITTFYFDASLSALSLFMLKHSGSPVSPHSFPSINLTIPGAHVNIRAIPKSELQG